MPSAQPPTALPAFPALPAPSRTRWQPLRSGILNLYRYDNEEFHYADGRLLLRGNNGSGKSRVLALQLPFLIDGNISPAHIEPDADPAKRIEWNLLMGRHHERTGYTWIEFGRLDENGAPRYLTLGCGLRAVSGHTGLHSRWNFITTQRIGQDLSLQNSQHIPLGREALANAIGPAGTLYHQKFDDYRRAVDAALFGLGPRYEALINLLILLRRPQLSKKIDENELPSTLAAALPTLPDAIIDEVAESFRTLQADKETNAAYAKARDAVSIFLQEYATYIRIATRRRAETLRKTHSAYERAQRAATAAAAAAETAALALETLQRQSAEHTTALASAESAERTLADDPRMRTADELRAAEQQAAATAKTLSDLETDATAARAARDQTHTLATTAETKTAALRSQLETNLATTTRAAALAAALETDHDKHLATIPPDPARAKIALDQTLAHRRRAIEQLDREHTQLETAARALATAEQKLRDAQDAASHARDHEHTARETLSTRSAEHLAAYDAWRSACHHLAPPATAGDLSETHAAWLDRREGTSPLRQAIDTARDTASAAHAAAHARLEQTASVIARNIENLDTQIKTIETGPPLPPPAPATRRADRSQLPGAPLWQLCDFHPRIPLRECAAIEAALQASGLLDAWLLPDGRLIDPATEDIFITPLSESEISNPKSEIPAKNLTAILRPAIPAGSEITATTLANTLSQITLIDSAASPLPPPSPRPAISTDGRWRNGPLTGFHAKPAPDYIGEENRAAHRQRALAALHAQRATQLADQTNTAAALSELATTRAAAAAEYAAAPADAAILEAGYALDRAALDANTARAAAERAERDTQAPRAEHDAARKTLADTARDLRLPDCATRERLNQIITATQDYKTALASLWPTLALHKELAAQHATQRQQAAAAQTRHEELLARRNAAAESAAAAQTHFETLRKTHGDDISEILEKHREAKNEVARIKTIITKNDEDQRTQIAALATANANKTSSENDRITHESARRQATARLRELASHRLLAEADPALRDITTDADWSATEAIDHARRVETTLSNTPATDDDWSRRQDNIQTHIQNLRDQLIAQNHTPETHQHDEIVTVLCPFQSRPRTMTELRAAFSAEIEIRANLLKAREREIIENHLLAEASVEIKKLIRDAEKWRADANKELAARPTSTGVRFRFQWEPDREIRFHEVRDILLRNDSLWTPAERDALSAFLQNRIAAEQAADDNASWREHLARALDYRRWHKFVIEREQDGKWRPLNKTTYGTGSAGEKALALTLPRFAAAAAHYQGAAKTAPRLVMLDEAFAGIDPDMRGQSMGVLTEFDLDVFMTNESEWGCYPTVPAISIYHLTTSPGIDAIAATRWHWNGHERKPEEIKK